MTKQDEWHMNVIQALEFQARDPHIWSHGNTATEIYLLQALRDLHRVIESNDLEALKRIVERAEDEFTPITIFNTAELGPIGGPLCPELFEIQEAVGGTFTIELPIWGRDEE